MVIRRAQRILRKDLECIGRFSATIQDGESLDSYDQGPFHQQKSKMKNEILIVMIARLYVAIDPSTSWNVFDQKLAQSDGGNQDELDATV